MIWIDSDAALFGLLRKPSRRRPNPDRPGHFLWGDHTTETELITLAPEQWQTILDVFDVLTSDESSEPPQDETTTPKQLTVLSDAQWQPIKSSLAAVGINADRLTLPRMQGEPLLRKALPWIADGVRLAKQGPTPKQAATELQKTQKMATALLERLSDPRNYNWFFPGMRRMAFPESLAIAELLPPLKGLIAELEHRLKTLAAIQSPQTKNACAVHNEFCRELERLWREFNPNTGKLNRRHLQRFLFACSEPFFLEVADTTIAAFVDHHYGSSKRRGKRA
jgi:hypothetical protein